MKNAILILSCVLALGLPSPTAAQPAGDQTPTAIPPPAAREVDGEGRADPGDNRRRSNEAQANPRFVRTLTNVQVELTLTDQLGSATPQRKTVSMIASSGSWGKIRSVALVPQVGDAPYPVELNVDARPFVSVEGPIQLELTLSYCRSRAQRPAGPDRQRPSGHQSEPDRGPAERQAA